MMMILNAGNSRLNRIGQSLIKAGEALKAEAELTYDKLSGMDLPNLRIVGTTSLCGPTLEDKPLQYLKMQKDLGIKTIVDLRAGAGKLFPAKCKVLGYRYYRFPLDDAQTLANGKYFVRKKNEKIAISQAFMDLIKNFFRVMNKGHVYAGCQYGIDRTNIGLSMNFLLNKNNNLPPILLTWPDETKKAVVNRNIKLVKKIFKAMTPEQRHELGLNDSYKDGLLAKVKTLLAKNRQL